MTILEKLKKDLSTQPEYTANCYSDSELNTFLAANDLIGSDTYTENEHIALVSFVMYDILDSLSIISTIDRLKLELNYQPYYSDNDYYHFLHENGLSPAENYIKAEYQAQLLHTVIDVLESLSNNIDYFRQIKTEFTTTTEAYTWLKDRINQIERKIATIPSNEPVISNITFMYHS